MPHPSPLEFRYVRWKLAALFALAILTAVMGGFALVVGDTLFDRLIGAGLAALCLLGALAVGHRLSRPAIAVILNETGLEDRRSKVVLPWAEVRSVKWVRVNGVPFLYLGVESPARFVRGGERHGLARWSRKIDETVGVSAIGVNFSLLAPNVEAAKAYVDAALARVANARAA